MHSLTHNDKHGTTRAWAPSLDLVKGARQALHVLVVVAGEAQGVFDAELLQGEGFRVPAGARTADPQARNLGNGLQQNP